MEIQFYSSLDRKIFLVSSFYTGIRKNKHTDKKTPALIGLHWLGSSCELIQNNQFPIIYYRRCYSHLIGQWRFKVVQLTTAHSKLPASLSPDLKSLTVPILSLVLSLVYTVVPHEITHEMNNQFIAPRPCFLQDVTCE